MRHAMDHSEVAALILMDLSKVFDCLPHDLMAAKLTAYGMSHSAVKLLVNYLRNLKQRVKIVSEVPPQRRPPGLDPWTLSLQPVFE